MEFNEIIQAVSTVGFPIVISGVLLYMMDRNNKDHKDEVASLKEAINNNTNVLSRILEHFSDVK